MGWSDIHRSQTIYPTDFCDSLNFLHTKKEILAEHF